MDPHNELRPLNLSKIKTTNILKVNFTFLFTNLEQNFTEEQNFTLKSKFFFFFFKLGRIKDSDEEANPEK